MCAIGRAFVVRNPTKCYAPTSDEFKEMVAVYLGPPSPLATQIGVGRRVRCPNKKRANLTLDKWGFAPLVDKDARAPRIHRFVALPPRRRYARHLRRHP